MYNKQKHSLSGGGGKIDHMEELPSTSEPSPTSTAQALTY